MPNERELKPVPPCLLPVNNLNLEPEHFGERLGWATSVCPARRAELSMTDARLRSIRTRTRTTFPVSCAPRATWAKRGDSGSRWQLRQRVCRATEEVGAHAAFGKGGGASSERLVHCLSYTPVPFAGFACE